MNKATYGFNEDLTCKTFLVKTLFQSGRASLGEAIYRYISSEEFSPVCLLECLDMSSEHQAIEIANRVEAAMYAWRKGTTSKPTNHNSSRSTSKSSWEMLKELVIDADKTQLFAERAESLLFCLKQQFPNLPQTSLDMSKIQFNKVDFSLSFTIPAISQFKSRQTPFESACFCSGRGQGHSGKLLESVGELGVQHRNSNRRSALCG